MAFDDMRWISFRPFRLTRTKHARTPFLRATSDLSVSVSVIHSTLQRWFFSRPVLNNAALLNPANYEVSPALSMLSVAAGPGANPSYVDVTTSEMQEGTSYTPTVHRVEAA